jgi:hypothetical protein
MSGAILYGQPNGEWAVFAGNTAGGVVTPSVIGLAGQLVAPGAMLAPMTITRSQAGGIQSSALAADGVSLDFYAANTPRFNGVSRRLLIEGTRTNLFLNSEVGATQDVTVTAVANTLTFWGTGTITLSGASTAGPLVGTGVNDRVSLTFTPSAGTLTLTVTGTCSRVQLEAGAFASSYITTTGSPGVRGADLPVATLAALGLPASGAHTSLLKILRTTNTTGSAQYPARIDDGSTANFFGLRGESGSANHQARRALASVGAGSANIAGPAAGNVYRAGFRVDGAGNASGYIDAATLQTVAGGPVSGLTTYRLGHGGIFGGESFWGEIEILQVLTTVLSDVAFQAAVAALP